MRRAIALMLMLVSLSACTGSEPQPANPTAGAEGPVGPGLPLTERLEDVRIAGEDPTITWSEVPGTATYGILAFPKSEDVLPWAWTGTATSVAFGTLDEEIAAGLLVPADPAPLDRPIRGETYTVIVAAMDASGYTITSSAPQEFTCRKPCGVAPAAP